MAEIKRKSRLDNIPLDKRGDIHLFKKGGKSPNPNGRPNGQRNYATIFREAMIKLAEMNNTTPNELEEQILQMGIKKARLGDYKFYQDIMDRLHGKPIQKQELTGKDGEALFDNETRAKTKSAIQGYIGGNTGSSGQEGN